MFFYGNLLDKIILINDSSVALMNIFLHFIKIAEL